MRCLNCGKSFEEPDEIKTSYEDYYGVADDFSPSTSLVLKVCPYCESEEWEYDEDDEEWENEDFV